MLKQVFVTTALVLSVAVAVAAPAKAKRSPSSTTTRSYASSSAGGLTGHAIQVHLGFGQSAVNFGGEFLMPASGPVEWGPYLFFYSENKDAGRGKVLTFGGSAKIHYNANPWDIYVAPGFGFISAEVGTEDESTFGPSLRVGAMYNLSETLSIGLEEQVLYNWFSEDLTGSANFTTATLHIGF